MRKRTKNVFFISPSRSVKIISARYIKLEKDGKVAKGFLFYHDLGLIRFDLKGKVHFEARFAVISKSVDIIFLF